MIVNVILPGWMSFAYLGEAEDMPGFVRAHDQVLHYSFDHYVGGHLTSSSNRVDVVVQREQINDVETNCDNALTAAAALCNEPNTTAVSGKRYSVREVKKYMGLF